MRRARPYRGENHGPGKDVQGELDLTPGIREQPGPITGIQKKRASPAIDGGRRSRNRRAFGHHGIRKVLVDEFGSREQQQTRHK